MLCTYNFAVPQGIAESLSTSGIEIDSATYSESGSIVNYDLSALPNCTDSACLSDSMEIAFPSVSGVWSYDSFSLVLGGGSTYEDIQTLTVKDGSGSTITLDAIQFNCQTGTWQTSTWTASGTGWFTQEDIQWFATVEAIITFFVLFFAWIYWITK